MAVLMPISGVCLWILIICGLTGILQGQSTSGTGKYMDTVPWISVLSLCACCEQLPHYYMASCLLKSRQIVVPHSI